MRSLHESSCTQGPAYDQWCALANGWQQGTAGSLTNARALVGLRVRLDGNTDTGDHLKHDVRMVAVAIEPRPDGPHASITELVPDNDQEREELTIALDSVQRALGGGPPAKLPHHLWSFLTAPGTAKHSLESRGSGWHFDAQYPAEIRRIGNMWGVVESPADGSFVFLSVMTDRIVDGEGP